jgi:hypothetical protein
VWLKAWLAASSLLNQALLLGRRMLFMVSINGKTPLLKSFD